MLNFNRSNLGTLAPHSTLSDTAAKANQAKQDLEQWFQAKPFLALGVSLGVGIFLGWLVKRR
mgnify:CR=1 FL=1